MYWDGWTRVDFEKSNPSITGTQFSLMAKSKSNSTAPIWIKLWLRISGVLVLYDAGYVLMRPRSMPGGDLFPIWQPYVLYAKVISARDVVVYSMLLS